MAEWMTSEDEDRREAALQRALDNPMDDGLRRGIATEIEPHTMNMGIDHGEVMTAIDIAYPLIRDWLRYRWEVE